ncbi:tetratricopeptide repeat protein 16 [Acanthochromis polyacanthus]|uniref:tetratricopeptide repeat protein 16 n=1 Tax=Acanthochromis polyacanthus TaxID=80966 RepID=UPI002234C4D5|nr:tetratricopeptide repeat protein 16 [Acanthochromis polyacanthus]XP_051806859.1 tetratricopeptide repeat protein 16 [Acanthochromis polyacanthus]
MDISEDKRDDKRAADQSLFSTAVSEDEARRKTSIKQLFGSSKIFLTPAEKQQRKPELRANVIIQNRAAEHCRNGTEAMGRCQYEKAVICFTKGINLLPEQTQLYVHRAEAFLQLCDFRSAAASYKQAEILQPGASSRRLAFICYLQGQCLLDRSLFLEALEAFSKAAELQPDSRVYRVRSVVCLSAAGRHSDALKLLNGCMTSGSPTADLYVLRARLHRRLQQTSGCYQDVRSALALNPSCPAAGALLQQLHEASEASRLKAVDKTLSGHLPEALCLINVALENKPEDPRLHLFRGILYRRLEDFTAAMEDLVQAAELTEEEEEEAGGQWKATDRKSEGVSVLQEVELQLVLTYNDLAVQCFSRRLYPEAVLLLNKAIEEEKNQAGLYLNRGDCFFKLGDWCFSLADYRQAEEMLPPEDPAVRLRLAVVHNTLGCFCFQDGRFQEAVDMLSVAIRYNPAAGRYYESRSKAFRKLLDWNSAREDFICMLVLDPNNQEVPPMLMSLFPGYSVSDVLSSPKGEAVRAQLMDTIQTWSSSSDPHRLSEKLQQINLTNENQSEDPTGAGEELKPCLNPEDLQITVKNLLQVESTVRSLVHSHPESHQTGPECTGPTSDPRGENSAADLS